MKSPKLRSLLIFFVVFYSAYSQPLLPTEVKATMDRVTAYLTVATPFAVVDRNTGAPITELAEPRLNATVAKTEYRLDTHEWGLTYSGMLLAYDATGEPAYKNYATQRLTFLSQAVPYFEKYHHAFPGEPAPLEIVFDPKSLDDSGSLCAAMIKGTRAGVTGLQPIIDNSLRYIMTKQYRLADGTFARNRPLPNTVWADDLYQCIPAIAQAGKTTGDKKYFDEAALQVERYANTVFNQQRKIFMHGWVQDMDPHPEFYWARVNGWAMMALVELLDVMPENHPRRGMVLELFRSHVSGVASFQSGSGLWHQLLDRSDSFLETSASAMFTFCLAHAINRGWISGVAYGPVALQAWKAVSAKVNAKGLVEGTSAGTSVSFDAAFYYNRPVGTGPHGYGSVMLAGAAMYRLLSEWKVEGTPGMFKK